MRHPAEASWLEGEPIQLEALARLRRLGRNADGESIVDLVIAKFCDEAMGWRIEMRAALSTGEVADIQRIAHTLRGSASILGAVRLAEICGELEFFAFNKDGRGCESWLPLFEDALEDVFSALSGFE